MDCEPGQMHFTRLVQFLQRLPATARARHTTEYHRRMAASLVMFGYCGDGASPSVRSRFAHFAEVLGKRMKLEVALFEAGSYEEIMAAVTSGAVDVAWLAPLPFLALEQRGAVVPLVHLHRQSGSTYRSVLVVRTDSKLATVKDLAGARAAWGDRQSASGFVVPRAALHRLGVDPRTAFPEQRLCRSHDSVVRAVKTGRADFGATYAGVGADHAITRGPWLTPGEAGPNELRVLEILDEIPGDVVVARAGLDPASRQQVLDALLGISRDRRSKLLAGDAFGVDEFMPFARAGYAELASLAKRAEDEGLLDVAAPPSRVTREHMR